MQNNQQSYFRQVGVQLSAIILASVGAVLISMSQSLVSGSVPCSVPPVDPTDAGVLGGLLKGVHSALLLSRGTMHT